MPGLLEPVKALPASNDSTDSSDSEQEIPRRRRDYGYSSGLPEEPITSDEDSDDSESGSRFSRVFVVNPDSDDSSSDPEDNADSGGEQCDGSYDKTSNS
ncbi:hypothetical protein PYW07_016011 [Mythimna separata]|uniref:Uncharacterized protein n=1 Tax=Mythimna separata TaxID=271217 RepID=A0AAD8DVT0_MYTSE|nr:hypothetical protein PYW07_016011 [Mythimna separata]